MCRRRRRAAATPPMTMTMSGGDESRDNTSRRSEKAPEEKLNGLVFWLAFLERAGSAVGTVAFIWATVVLLGGFCSQLNPLDFWFATVIIFVEATRVFIRQDSSANQRVFGTTRALLSTDFSSAGVLARPQQGGLAAVAIGLCANIIPFFQPPIAAAIVKVGILLVIWQLIARDVLSGKALWVFVLVLLLLNAASVGLGVYYFIRFISNREQFAPQEVPPTLDEYTADFSVGSPIIEIVFQPFTLLIITSLRTERVKKSLRSFCLPVAQRFKEKKVQLWVKIITAILLGLMVVSRLVIPILHDSGMSLATLLLAFAIVVTPEENNNKSSRDRDCFWVLDLILHMLFLWNKMYPLPGVPTKISLLFVLPLLAALLIGNLQIPVAFVQLLLSALRLSHRHDYHPLPQGTSPNMVPSIIVFFVLELCQGLLYIVASILGLFSFFPRRSLLHKAGLTGESGDKAVSLYYHCAYHKHIQDALFSSAKYTTSLASFAIRSLSSSFDTDSSLGFTSRQMHLAGLCILDSFLQPQSRDPDTRNELIIEITLTSKDTVLPTLIGLLGRTAARDEDIRMLAARVVAKLAGSLKIAEAPGTMKLVSSLLHVQNKQESPAVDAAASESSGGSICSCLRLPALCCCPRNDQREECRVQVQEGTATVNAGSQHRRCPSECFCCCGQRMKQWWSRWSIPPQQTDRGTLPVLGVQILENLAYDPDNCTEIAKDFGKIITKITGLINGDIGDTQKKQVVCSSLGLVRRLLGSTRGKIGATFRQELWENPFLLDSHLQRILNLELDPSQPELWEPVMDIIAKLALDEAPRQAIGSTQGIIGKLMHALFRPDDLVPNKDNYRSLRMAAGEALANLTVLNKDNCWAILEEPGYDNLIKDLMDMLHNGYYVAGNLLYNLCADHSRDKLIGLASAKLHLESAMPDVMKCTKTTKEGKQLEAVLCVASQIGYVIPQHFATALESDTYRAELVKKLDMKPCAEYPRMRRLLVEMVISIIENAKLCPGCINSFIEQGVLGALDKVKRTPSRLEKYRVFLDGEGVVVESLSMGDLVDKAKSLINQAKGPADVRK
ncbi:hypothetical protein ACP4OV_018425 [Aristida adscensionis]